MKFPDCSPNFSKNYISEKQMMFLDEENFISTWSKALQPSHIVILSKFYENEYIRDHLENELNYEKVIM